MNQIKSSSIFIQVTVAALLYNLLHILAWELPWAVRMGWRINAFRKAFPTAYRDIRVGKNLVIGRYVSSSGILNNAKEL